MTDRATEIETLIAEIDNLLVNKGRRLPRVLSSLGQELRQVLERTREFLVREASLEAQVKSAPLGLEQQQLPPMLGGDADRGTHVGHRGNSSLPQQQPNPESGTSIDLSGQNNAFSALLTPLQAELQALLLERATLVQEIRQLEQRRVHNYSLAQQMANQEKIISEFLQVLMSRLTPNQTPPMAGTMASPQPLLTIDASTSTASQFQKPLDLVEHLAQLTTQLDQRLLALDGTVNVVFEALQRNIHTYHESLSQSLARMHSSGVQGEQLLAGLISNLMEQLQQQTTSKATNVNVEEETSPTDSLVRATDNEETPVTPDLDAVLLQLGQDAPSSDTATTASRTELHYDTATTGDEVDKLYASLFSNDNLTDSSGTPIQTTEKVRDITSRAIASQSVEATDISPSAIVTPDPWFDEPDAGLLNQSNVPTQQSLDSPIQSPEISSTFNTLVIEGSTAPENLVEEPASTDTIAVLTDLLTNVSSDELSELPSLNALSTQADQESPELKVPSSESKSFHLSTEKETSNYYNSEIRENGDSEQSLDNYIPASKSENLLDHEEIATPVPEISLEEEQLRQLEQDLANFDQQLSYLMEHANNKKNQENTEKTSRQELPRLDVELDSSATATPLSETEKTEVLIEEQRSLSISNSVNNTKSENIDAVWYLGIDIGTTGISAVLLNRSTSSVYPLYWSAENQMSATSTRSFRLPAEVYLPTTSLTHQDSSKGTQDRPSAVVASELETDNQNPTATNGGVPHQTENLFSAQLKPYLQISLPYKSDRSKWEPVLQLNESSTVPLVWVVRSLSKLLSTLKSDRSSTTLGLTAAAVGLDQTSFLSIINNIAGVICTCPSNCSEQYRFNVREALLTCGLVQHSQQVFFVEEAIASLLSELDVANGEVKLSSPQGFRLLKTSDYPLIGSTLAINIGAAFTEMALVDLPEDLEDLTHSDFMLHGFAYAGKGIEQDIICQMLFPPKWRQSRTQDVGPSHSASTSGHWTPAIPGLDRMHLSSLAWSELNLPRPGEPDITDRIRLSQRLESSLLGKAVLEAAIALKLVLQHQDSFTLELADQRWVLQRRDLESQVFVPFVRRLNRELNKLLIAKGLPTEAISQAILTGGVASIGAVSRWLRQKLPNAKMIQEKYENENGAPTCSRVAYGLTMLPLHPQVLEVPRQQYTDYFLFTELLQLLPERTFSFGEIIQLFESRGINTRSCQQRLLAFLDRELPTGLIPSVTDSTWLTQSSKENPDYQAIAAAPLFEKQGNLSYRPNSEQLRYVLRYLDAIKASTRQSLSEPYTVNFTVGVVQ